MALALLLQAVVVVLLTAARKALLVEQARLPEFQAVLQRAVPPTLVEVQALLLAARPITATVARAWSSSAGLPRSNQL
jgi:hypothetical protein